MTTRPDAGGIAVVKLGGSTLGAHDTSLRDIADAHRRGERLVVVHGGGAAVSEWLERSGIAPEFSRGLRVTDAATLDVAVAVLAGLVNQQLVAQLAALGARASGLSGADGGALVARRYDDALGYVGRIDRVETALLLHLLDGGWLPVIAPIAVDAEGGGLLNTNADTAAGEIAAALSAARLVFLTDVAGVLDEDKRLVLALTSAEASALVASGVAAGGMIPKLEAAMRAAQAGCATRIVDGTATGALAAVLSGAGGGTTITG